MKHSLSLVMAFAFAGLAHAETWYVDNNPDDGVNPPGGVSCPTCSDSIQDAISDAQAGDTIRVYPGTYQLPAVAASSLPVLDFKGKAVHVCAQFPLASNESERSVISGALVRRCVVANSGEGAGSVLEGFFVQDGRAASGAGANIVSSSPRFVRCRFESNQTVGPNTSGGAVRLFGSQSEFDSCEFASNYAVYEGGAVRVTGGRVRFTGSCKFENNWSGWRGGALSLLDDETTVTGATLRANRSVGTQAGSIFAQNSAARFESTVIRDSTVTNTYFGTNWGGAAVILGTTRSTLFLNCQFISNRSDSYYADYGGAVVVGFNQSESGSASFLNCLFDGNRSQDGFGGAISFGGNGNLLVQGCEFRTNAAGSGGGALALGISGEGGSVDIRYCVFKECNAANGGAIYTTAPKVGSARSVNFCAISSSSAGSAIQQTGSGLALSVSASAFCDNSPQNFLGGTIVSPVSNCFPSLCNDSDDDGWPDACQPEFDDCNGNGALDYTELFEHDINNDGILDDCQPSMTFAGLSTEIVPILNFVSGLPSTSVCWRVYANFRDRLKADPPLLAQNGTVTAIYGNAAHPLNVSSAAGFFQAPAPNPDGVGEPIPANTAEDIPCGTTVIPLRYDSFFTIDAQCRSQGNLQLTPGLSFDGFNAPTNSVFGTSNGAIFVNPDDPGSRAGEDGKVLLMQLTTKSVDRPTATINLRGRVDVAGMEIWDAFALPIPAPVVTAAVDCNGNGVHDALEIASGLVRDCNVDGIPDSCQSGGLANDCDGDGTPDACEIIAGTATDTNSNGVPDNCECQGDVDRNGAVNVDDLLEVFATWGMTGSGLPADVDGNGVVGPGDIALVLAGWGICL